MHEVRALTVPYWTESGAFLPALFRSWCLYQRNHETVEHEKRIEQVA